MNRISRHAVPISIGLSVFVVGSPLAVIQSGGHASAKLVDVVNLVTPLALIPLYWAVLQTSSDEPDAPRENLVFLFVLLCCAGAQGMSLAAYSTGHFVGVIPGGVLRPQNTFFDQVLRHYLWHFQLLVLSALVIYHQGQHLFREESAARHLVTVAAFIHGVSYFVTAVEARTIPSGAAFAVLATIGSVVWARVSRGKQPLPAFFSITFAAAAILFTGWAACWAGIRVFSAVGIIS